MKCLRLGLCALAFSVQAANAADSQADRATQSSLLSTFATGVSAVPSLQSITQPFLAAINSDDKTASVSGKFDLPTYFNFGASTNFLTVTAQTPVSQGSDFTNVATLDGLTGSTNVEARLSIIEGGVADHRVGVPDGNPPLLPIWTATFDGKVGTQDHQYYDPTTLKQLTSHTVSWQVGGSLGRIFNTGLNGQAALNLNFDYQESYRDGDTGQTRTQCLTPDNCVTGFIGAPVLMRQGLLSGDLRWIGEISPIGNKKYPVGVEVKVTYDPIHDSEAVQVPIYFATNDKGSLTGGVRYDWQSDSHVSTIGVFVSSAFSIGFAQ